MRKEISDFLVISLVLVAFVNLVIIVIQFTVLQLEDGFSMFIVWAYFATAIFFLGDSIYLLGKKTDLIWKRRDWVGMLVCVVGVPVCSTWIVLGSLLQFNHEILNCFTLGAIMLSMILWTKYHYVYCDTQEALKELCNTIRRVVLAVTMLGILQTDMPDDYLKLLFVIIGCGSLVIEEIFQNKKLV